MTSLHTARGDEVETYAEAWADYLKALEDSRAMIEADPACADPKVRDAALWLPTQLQAIAFHMYLAPHRGYPNLYLHQVQGQFEVQHGLPNPDYVYRYGFIDGRRRYRIFGPRPSPAAWFNLHMLTGWWGDLGMRELANVEINDFTAPDGSIELFIGPEKLTDRDIVVDPSERHIVMNIREAMEDWANQEVTPLRIECLDEGDRGPFLYPESDLIQRLVRAAEMVRGTARRTIRNRERLLEAAGGENRFFIDAPSAERAANAANLTQTMVNCIYRVEPGQSLIIETEMPQAARYWGIQLGDLWWRTVDYAYHQSSLNRKNAWFGADGMFRAVVSHEDPGVQNWLDPVDNDRGQILIRLNQAVGEPVPRTKLVPSSEVRQHLPADTPAFSPQQRRAQIAARTEHVLRRFGY
jgi:hypothetical protein